MQPVSVTPFTSKQNFLKKSQQAVSSINKRYYESLHYEAKSRANYVKYNNAILELDKFGTFDNIDTFKKAFSLLKTFSKILYRKICSAFYEQKAYGLFPDRFLRPDDFHSKVFRYYDVKNSYLESGIGVYPSLHASDQFLLF